MDEKIIYNGQIFDGDNFIQKDAVHIKEGKIIGVLSSAKLSNTQYDTVQKIDAEGKIIMPGMIDLQLNGCGGVLFNDVQDSETLAQMAKTNFEFGCTSFLPTLITSEDAKMKTALKLMKEIGTDNGYGALGLHLEGPMIQVNKRGIHNPSHIHVLNKTMLNTLEKHKAFVKFITVAPEVVPTDVLKRIYEMGIGLSIGHTSATYETCEEKGEYLTHATHLFNAMEPLTGREPGVISYLFTKRSHYTGIIADGYHVHKSNIQLAQQILRNKLYVTTDAVTPAGREDIESFIFEGQTVYYKDGKCSNKDGKLGGSAATMLSSIKYLNTEAELPIETTLKMATSIPARAISEDTQYGYIKEGYTADITILDEVAWEISLTLKHGEIVYANEK